MTANAFSLKSHFFFLSRLLNRQLKTLRRTISNSHANQLKQQSYPWFAKRQEDIANSTLIFDVEGSLLKSTCLFPYFMLVAFEAGCFLRALILLILYPFICLVREEMALDIMVMVSFFGIKKESFKVGRAVLPKYFLEDIGLDSFDLLKKGNKTVAVSKLPQVMIESFLIDYLEIDHVAGRELKVVGGYYVGLMENKDRKLNLEDIIEENGDVIIGICGFNSSSIHEIFSYCREIYSVSKVDKKSWQILPKDKYSKPLIFHDGRLAFRPFAVDTLAMFMWVSFGLILAITRMAVTLSLPYYISTPMLAVLGVKFTSSKPKNTNVLEKKTKDHKGGGLLYVCNHRTLLDPLCVSFSMKRNVTAVTYSLSRFSELLAPIKTVRLTRNRDEDAKMMKKLLNEGDLVVCPEGTTCREPYLLRFSPLFAEMSDYIAPVALNTQVSMFHGTTASGFKAFDPIFYLLNPSPCYTMQLLDAVPGLSNVANHDHDQAQCSTRYDIANHVQKEIGHALGFECTKLTRRDKYLILAGNEGITPGHSKP